MTNVKNISRIVSKHNTTKAIKKLFNKPTSIKKPTSITKPIKEKKSVDWTTPKEERHNQIKRSWITDKK
tara:strand:- start:300 stop:506 length:207 start_codon:yes stop_codon:yes gene_type:complete